MDRQNGREEKIGLTQWQSRQDDQRSMGKTGVGWYPLVVERKNLYLELFSSNSTVIFYVEPYRMLLIDLIYVPTST